MFSAPLIALAIMFGNSMSRVDVVKNGTKTVATVDRAISNVEINGVPRYTVYFTFTDKDGALHDGKTDAYYLYDEVKDLKELALYLFF